MNVVTLSVQSVNNIQFTLYEDLYFFSLTLPCSIGTLEPVLYSRHSRLDSLNAVKATSFERYLNSRVGGGGLGDVLWCHRQHCQFLFGQEIPGAQRCAAGRIAVMQQPGIGEVFL